MSARKKELPGTVDPVSPAEILELLASLCGIGPEVAELLEGKALAAHPPLSVILNAKHKVMRRSLTNIAGDCGISGSRLFDYIHQIGTPGLRSVVDIAHGFDIPAILVLMASLESAGLLKNAPGAKKARTRIRKKRPPGDEAGG
jgi:DNA-binding phage protein